MIVILCSPFRIHVEFFRALHSLRKNGRSFRLALMHMKNLAGCFIESLTSGILVLLECLRGLECMRLFDLDYHIAR